jgi:uncharacterized membrane protein YidH (DUF202 family)
LTTIFALLFLSGEILSFSAAQDHLFLSLSGVFRAVQGSAAQKEESTFIYSLLLLVIPLLSLITIFLYKNRKVQMRLTFVLIILVAIQIIASFYIMYDIERKFDAEIIPGIKHILPALMLITSFLAYRGIKKDEDIVRSYDRLR